MKTVSIRRWLSALILTTIVAVFIFVILPPSRDAMNGIVTVYSYSQATGSASSIKFKAVIDAQAVIELREITIGAKKTSSTLGFDKCSIFNRTNWRCERSGNKFLMQNSNLTILNQNGDILSPETKQVSRLSYWANQLRF